VSGTGKTTLLTVCRLAEPRGRCYRDIFNSQLDTSQLFDFMMADFGIPCESPQSHVLMRLNHWLCNVSVIARPLS